MKIFRILFCIVFIVGTMRYAYSVGNTEKYEDTVNVLDNAKVSYEQNTGSTKVTLNVIKFYAAFWGDPEDNKAKIKYLKEEIDILETGKRAIIQDFEKRLKSLLDDKRKLISDPKGYLNTGQINTLNGKIKALRLDYDEQISKIESIRKNENKDEQNNDNIEQKLSELNKHRRIFFPINLYSNLRIENNTHTSDSIKIINSDFLNPLGGIVTLQLYKNFHPSKYSTDTRYWSLKPSISGSWIRVTNNDAQINYDSAAIRLNFDVSFIIPVFAENMNTDAGTIKFNLGVSNNYFFCNSNTGQLYDDESKRKPYNGQTSIRWSIDINLTNYLSFTFEYIYPILGKDLGSCIYISSSIARF